MENHNQKSTPSRKRPRMIPFFLLPVIPSCPASANETEADPYKKKGRLKDWGQEGKQGAESMVLRSNSLFKHRFSDPEDR